jgi:hypothetical protein
VGERDATGSAACLLLLAARRCSSFCADVSDQCVFAASFGFLEATVVVYLRAAAGLLPGYRGTLSDVIRLSGEFYRQAQAIGEFPQSLITLEVLREAATILVLLSVAVLSSAKRRSRAAIFLWTFAIWDIVYYASLWATVRWPPTLRERDVLFLIPVPWFAPVWFPLLGPRLAAPCFHFIGFESAVFRPRCRIGCQAVFATSKHGLPILMQRPTMLAGLALGIEGYHILAFLQIATSPLLSTGVLPSVHLTRNAWILSRACFAERAPAR